LPYCIHPVRYCHGFSHNSTARIVHAEEDLSRFSRARFQKEIGAIEILDAPDKLFQRRNQSPAKAGPFDLA
jgi:hypothetical protein